LIQQKGVLAEEPIMHSQGFSEGFIGILETVISIANNGKATRQATRIDNRSWWTRNKEACAEWFMSGIILLNTVSLGVSADLHATWPGWLIIDSIFAGFFFLAMVTKMWSWGLKKYFSVELHWNLFELVVVGLAVLEVCFVALDGQDDQDASKFPLLRMLRLSRIARIVRVCRLQMFSELTMMINGAVGSMRTLLWSMLLITLPVYGMALLLRESLGGQVGAGTEGFQSVLASFFTVFRCLVANECTTAEGKPIFVLVSSEYGWALAVFYCVVTVLMSFGLYNVIMAIYVENIVAAAKYNDLHQKRQRFLDSQVFAEKVIKLVDFICRVHTTYERNEANADDEQHSNTSNSIDMDHVSAIEITPDFFEFLRTFREFQDLLNDLDIADEDQFDLFHTLDVDGSGAIDLEELVVGICKLRGPARRSDIIGVDLVARATQRSVEKLLQKASKHASLLSTLQVSLRDCNHALSGLRGMHRATLELLLGVRTSGSGALDPNDASFTEHGLAEADGFQDKLSSFVCLGRGRSQESGSSATVFVSEGDGESNAEEHADYLGDGRSCQMSELQRARV